MVAALKRPATMARVVMVALLLLLQLCNVILAARPLLQVAAAGGGRGISEALIMEVLGGPGGSCHEIQAPNLLCPPPSP